MSQDKTLYICSHCDSQYAKWQGQCDECGKWGTVKEAGEGGEIAGEVVSLKNANPIQRVSSRISEVDNVLGGGVVPGSLILLAGDPGIGKSTLVLQMIAGFNAGEVLYVCGEESPDQIGMRIKRLNINANHVKFLPATRINSIVAAIKSKKPLLAIVDSIQTVYSDQVQSEAGNISQIKAVTGQLLQLAKETNIPIIAIGHVTKEGVAAGPQALSHMVDVVLYLEGDKLHQYRLLRGVKNRFGSTNQIGVFSMTEKGLHEVKNPSQLFLGDFRENVAGSAVSVIMEGSRPFLIEVQALTNKTSYGYPKRAASGFDLNRLELLLAVLQRRAGLKLENQDVFLNIAGGLRTKDTALDLAACLAIASSLSNQSMPRKSVVLGEVGLGGEVRPIGFYTDRMREAQKLGFEIFVAPKQEGSMDFGQKITSIQSVAESLRVLGI